MGTAFVDLLVLARCGRLAAGLPVAAVTAWRSRRALADGYRLGVRPLVDAEITDPAERPAVDQAMRAMSLKIALVLLMYGRMVGLDRPPELLALAGAATRLYDDLIDTGDDPALDDRLTALFDGRPVQPRLPGERLLARLHARIGELTGTGGAADHALGELHEYQCLSRRQRDCGVPVTLLLKITRGKGALANLTLCGLVQPTLDVGERELVMAFGEALQTLDDYMDVAIDRANGVTTLATLDQVTLADIGRRLLVLHGRAAARYGPARARRYAGTLYFLLVKAFMGRRLPAAGRLLARIAGRSTVLTFLTRGDDALPAAGAGR